jgi:hypothetical protein
MPRAAAGSKRERQADVVNAVVGRVELGQAGAEPAIRARGAAVASIGPEDGRGVEGAATDGAALDAIEGHGVGAP